MGVIDFLSLALIIGCALFVGLASIVGYEFASIFLFGQEPLAGILVGLSGLWQLSCQRVFHGA